MSWSCVFYNYRNMEHKATKTELEMTSQMDFVVPLKHVGIITRSVLEAIYKFHHPRRIIVVSSKPEGTILNSLVPYWDVGQVDFFDEDNFFSNNHNVSMKDLLNEYAEHREGDQREAGWWIQQLIKLGAATQIANISEHYVVWDGDLVPLRRWRLCERDALNGGGVKYSIAILQAEARSQFNTTQYAECMASLTGLSPVDPVGGGTFVAHHMVFSRRCVLELLALMVQKAGPDMKGKPWPLLIMSSGRRFFRFSEYKTYAAFMLSRHPADFHYHPLPQFGEGGLRFRDASAVAAEMLRSCPLADGGLSYDQVRSFAASQWRTQQQQQSQSPGDVLSAAAPGPAYVQLDHVYGLDGVDLRLTTVRNRCGLRVIGGQQPGQPQEGVGSSSGTVRRENGKKRCIAGKRVGGEGCSSESIGDGPAAGHQHDTRWRRSHAEGAAGRRLSSSDPSTVAGGGGGDPPTTDPSPPQRREGMSKQSTKGRRAGGIYSGTAVSGDQHPVECLRSARTVAAAAAVVVPAAVVDSRGRYRLRHCMQSASITADSDPSVLPHALIAIRSAVAVKA